MPMPQPQHSSTAATAAVPAAPEIRNGRLFIGGKWRDSRNGKTFPSIDPATEEVICEVAEGTAEDVHDAAVAARKAFEASWGRMKGSERAKIMNRIADLIDERAYEVAYREVVDMGKLWRDVVSIDIPHIANMFRYYAGWATKIVGAVKNVEPVGHQGEILAYTIRQPLGVIAAITPFNFPLILTVSKIAPALAAGNTFIHKQASDTPLSAITLAEIIEEAGVPEGAYNLVTGPGGVVGQALVKHRVIDKIALTGSTGSGQAIIRDSADTIKHLTMELGGKSPNIIFADADLEKAVLTAFYAIFWNKGEVCVAGSRLLVEESVYEEVVDRLIARIKQAKTGDPFDEASAFGPIASKSEFDKVLRYIRTGKDQDKANLAIGGSPLKVNGKGIPLRVLVRRVTPNPRWEGLGIQQVAGDVADVNSLGPAFDGVNSFFPVTPLVENLVELGVNAIAAAKKAGIAYIVRSSAIGASEQAITMGRWHREVEKAVETSGIPHTILQPNTFMQSYVMSAESIKKENAFYLPQGDGRVSLVDAQDIAEIAVACLSEADHKGQKYMLTAPEALSNLTPISRRSSRECLAKRSRMLTSLQLRPSNI